MECLRSTKVKMEIDTNKRTIEEEWDDLEDAIVGLAHHADDELAHCDLKSVFDRLAHSFCLKCGNRAGNCQCEGDN